ncbi:hypothetical protein HDU81_007153 [Chytriomyces hyalinus]|nr:hypothetical protein HDU81_007153 [Chytriomyces hyalinus]
MGWVPGVNPSDQESPESVAENTSEGSLLVPPLKTELYSPSLHPPLSSEPEVTNGGIDSPVQESPELTQPIHPGLPTIAPKPQPMPAQPPIVNEESQSSIELPISSVPTLSSLPVETTNPVPSPEKVTSAEVISPSPSPQPATSESSAAPETISAPLSSATRGRDSEMPPSSLSSIAGLTTIAPIEPRPTRRQSEEQSKATSSPTKTSSSAVAPSTIRSSIPVSSSEKMTSASVTSTTYVAPLVISTTSPSSESNTGLIIGVVVGIIAALCLLGLGYWRYRTNSSSKSRSAAVTLAELASVNASPDDYAKKMDLKAGPTYPRSSPNEFILADGSAARGTGQLGVLVNSSGGSWHSAQQSPPVPSPQGEGDTHLWTQQLQQQQEQQLQQQQMLHYQLYQQQHYAQQQQPTHEQMMAWYHQNEQYPQHAQYQQQAWQQQWTQAPTVFANTNEPPREQGSNPPPDNAP